MLQLLRKHRPSTAKEESTDQLENDMDIWREDACYTSRGDFFFSFYMLSQRGSLALPEFTQGIYKEKKKRRKRNVLHNTQL